jgi:hypothetical protein
MARVLPRISLCSYNLIRVIRVIRGYLEELVPLHSLAGSGSTAKTLGDSLLKDQGLSPMPNLHFLLYNHLK